MWTSSKGLGFTGGSDGKESACSVGDPASISGSGRSPGEVNGYPLQYSCLKNSMDRGAWWVTVHGNLQARIPEWVAFPFSRESSKPRDPTQVFRIAGRFFPSWAQEYIVLNARLDEAKAGIKIAGRNISNLLYADNTNLKAQSKEELKSLLMKVKEESEKASLKLNIQKWRS